MVFLVKNLFDERERPQVLKLFTWREGREFCYEVEMNLKLHMSVNVVKMIAYAKSTDYMSLMPFLYNGKLIESYSYILLPFC